MAEDQDRAARIAELKEQHPRLTWAKIAEQVGVTERAATEWRKTGALKPENAEALARVFNVDFDYIWTGPRPDTPQMFADRRNRSKTPIVVDRIDGELEERITRIEGTLQEILLLLGAVLERIETATEHADDAAGKLDEAVERAGRALRSAKSGRPPAAAKPAPRRSRQASGQDPA